MFSVRQEGDGILVAGDFGCVRLNSDGSPDEGFGPLKFDWEPGRDYDRAIRALVTDDARHGGSHHAGQDPENPNNDKELEDGKAPSNIFVIFRHDFHAILPTRGGRRERGAPALSGHSVAV